MGRAQESASPQPETLGQGQRWRAMWYLVVFMAMLTIPASLRYGVRFWDMRANDQVQLWVWGAAFLLWVVLVELARPQMERRPAWRILLVGGITFGAGWGYLWMLAEFPHSRLVALSCFGLALAGALMPQVSSLRWLRVSGLAGAVTITAVAIATPAPRTAPAIEARRIKTVLYDLTATTYRNLVPTGGRGGGALVPWGNGFLLATAQGEFYQIGAIRAGEPLMLQRLPLLAPLNLERYLAHDLGPHQREPLRVTSLLVEEEEVPNRVIVAHQHWNSADACFSMRVSMAVLPGVGEADDRDQRWTELLKSEPCLALGEPLNALETGGRLARLGPDALLISIGSHGFDGLVGPVFAQDSTSDYGKVWLLAAGGRQELLTRGHRNPQGLLVARDGRIWSTEHGPAGGDELNLLRPGGNYGWPFATYGTQYGMTAWPLTAPAGDHAGYTEPALAFVPSVAPSSLVQINGGAFPGWDGDLILGTLAGQSLYRIRERGGQALFAEPIRIGQRIRSLAQGQDGGLLLWTDRNDLIHLSPAPFASRADSVFQLCTGCHGPGLEGAALGPSLHQVMGRPVASLADFRYSPALQALGGRWTGERLDAFLRNPATFAPGTSMRFAGIENGLDRNAVIQLVRSASRPGTR